MVNEHLPKSWLLPLQFQFRGNRQSPTHRTGALSAQRLLIVTQFYPPDYAATGQLISELATRLGELGMQVNIFTGQPGYAFEKDSAPKHEVTERVNVQRSRTSRILPFRIRGRAINGLLFCLRAALHLLKTAKQRDLLTVSTEPAYLPFLGYIAHLLFGIPYICILYDLYPDVAVQLNVVSPRHWLVRLWDWCNRQTWKHARRIIVLSPSMKSRVAEKYPEIARKIAIIPSWADPDEIAPIDKQQNWFARKFDLADTFTVLYSGNLGRCHDFETLLEAANSLRDEPIRFVFIGQGAKLESCRERVKHLELTNCLFLPYQDKSVLPYSLTACDLSIVSIGYGLEGVIAPSKLYGSLAAGRPVAAICEPHSYLRELLAGANCGRAFNNGDSEGLADFIRYLAANPDFGKGLGLSGRAYLMEHFTPEIVAREYFQLFEGAIGECDLLD